MTSSFHKETGSPPDVELMGRVMAGDRDAFADLFDRHASVVLGFLIKMLRNREEAEELLQDVFCQAWEQADRYQPQRAKVRSWLVMMARSRALDRLRSSTSRQQREQTVGGEAESTESPVGTGRLELAETRGEVGRALAELPPEQRRCIELAFWRGMTHTEIAAQEETPLGTVKSRIALGMNRLRRALTP